jgi:hypothetical protein
MRINFFGGPGSGKSTTAAYLFSEFKYNTTISIELVREYVKNWAYEKRPVNKFDQIYIFGKQMREEYRNFLGGVQHIVTDSPLYLGPVYARKYIPDTNIAESLEGHNRDFEQDFPSLNIFLDRGDKLYNPEGRYQSAEEAKAIDGATLKYLDKLGLVYYRFPFREREAIRDFVKRELEKITPTSINEFTKQN